MSHGALKGFMTLNIGDTAPAFELQNSNESQGLSIMALEDSRRVNGLIVVFECNHCPYVIGSISRLEKMAGKANGLDIGFVGINSNDPTAYPNDSFEHMQNRAEGMSYPYLHDANQDVAHAYDAKRTPEFFLFNNDLKLVYKGRMDDSPQDPTRVQMTELDDAMQAMLAGVAPEITVTESIGCSVKWKM
ncbi:MAG: thioredoxin family protein [Candidatus Poseidoniaceae archaeon]